MTTQITRHYWINTLKGWAEDRLMPPQFDECCAVLDAPAAELDKELDKCQRDYAKLYARLRDYEIDTESLRAQRDDLLTANRLSLRNVESMIYTLPIDCDHTERKSLETWATVLRAAIARATGQSE